MTFLLWLIPPAIVLIVMAVCLELNDRGYGRTKSGI